MVEQIMQDAAGKAIPAGYQQTEVGVIPHEWNVRKLKEISPSQSVGLVINPSSYYSSNGSIPMLVGSHVSENKIFWSNANKITEESNAKLPASRLNAGDLVTVRVGAPGITAVVPIELDKANCASMMIIRKSDCFDSQWLCYLMNSKHGKACIEGVQYGTAQKQFNIIDAVEFLFPVPPKQEQTAIANVLSDSDALIGSLEQLIAKKQAIKSATMQQLLTGRTRLPQFALRPDGTPKGYKTSELGHIPEDWHEVSLSSVTKNIDAGVSVNSIDQLDAYGHGKHVLKTSCVNGGVFNCLEAKSIIPSDTGRAKCFPCEGNIIVSRMNTPALVGEIGYIEKSLPGYFLPDRLWQVSFREDAELNTKWLMYVLAHPINSKKIKESATGTSNSMKNISKNAFLALNFYKPNIEEQTAIATILSDMDSELNALKQKLAKARDLKQGMMQQLLTGRIRLPVEQVE
ncbi:restriction endonuclease subunit S [Aeromonas veronii]|uniref:restriction endonuclease subunit S n=1 Tax=Aeromonas veronii TaxID=654 RepID=UPI000B59973E|nr:restriction endonuclease subunit S [Aeromonas veronii]